MGGKKKTENKPRSPSRKEAEEGRSLHSSWPPAPSISATLFEKGSFHFYRKSYSIVQHGQRWHFLHAWICLMTQRHWGNRCHEVSINFCMMGSQLSQLPHLSPRPWSVALHWACSCQRHSVRRPSGHVSVLILATDPLQRRGCLGDFGGLVTLTVPSFLNCSAP